MASAYLQMAERPTIHVSPKESSHQALREDTRSMKKSAATRVKAWGEFAQEQIFRQTGQKLDPKQALEKLKREASG